GRASERRDVRRRARGASWRGVGPAGWLDPDQARVAEPRSRPPGRGTPQRRAQSTPPGRHGRVELLGDREVLPESPVLPVSWLLEADCAQRQRASRLRRARGQAMTRLPVRKTYKLFIGGAFPR